jgi:hypothetical protein
VIGLRMDRRKICGKNGLKINRRGGGKWSTEWNYLRRLRQCTSQVPRSDILVAHRASAALRDNSPAVGEGPWGSGKVRSWDFLEFDGLRSEGGKNNNGSTN